jgi:hypothetical protein
MHGAGRHGSIEARGVDCVVDGRRLREHGPATACRHGSARSASGDSLPLGHREPASYPPATPDPSRGRVAIPCQRRTPAC